jgi:hypothetical protein
VLCHRLRPFLRRYTDHTGAAVGGAAARAAPSARYAPTPGLNTGSDADADGAAPPLRPARRPPPLPATIFTPGRPVAAERAETLGDGNSSAAEGEVADGGQAYVPAWQQVGPRTVQLGFAADDTDEQDGQSAEQPRNATAPMQRSPYL